MSPPMLEALGANESRRHGLLLGLAAVLVLGAAAPLAAQEAEDTADSQAAAAVDVDPSLWILDFSVVKIRTITVLEGPQRGRIFWGMVYDVKNKSGEDRQAYLAVSATSDRKKTYAEVFMPDVERAFERKLGQPLWGRTDLQAAQKDRDPEDAFYNYATFENAKTKRCVAILHKLDPGANRITITVRGLSNDLKLIENDDGTRVIEERVYVLECDRPKDPYKINLDRIVIKKKGWEKLQTKLVIPEGDPEEADLETSDDAGDDLDEDL